MFMACFLWGVLNLFVCASVKNYKSLDFVDKIRFRLGKYKNNVVEINTTNMRYHIVELIQKKDKIDFDILMDIAPRFSKNIVMPKDIILPGSLNIKQHKPNLLEKQICLNGIFEIFNKSKIPFVRQSLGFVDEQGIYNNYVEKMIRHIPTVKVYTKNQKVYEKVSEDMMDIYGAPLMVGESIDFLNDCNIVFTPEGKFSFSSKTNFLPIVISPKSIEQNSTCTFQIGEVEFPQKYIDEISMQYDLLTFFDAAFTFCNTKDLVNCKVLDYNFNGDIFCLKEMVKLIEKRYKKSICSMP